MDYLYFNNNNNNIIPLFVKNLYFMDYAQLYKYFLNYFIRVNEVKSQLLVPLSQMRKMGLKEIKLLAQSCIIKDCAPNHLHYL